MTALAPITEPGLAPILAELEPHVAGWLLGYANDRTRYEYGHDVQLWISWCLHHDVHPYRAERPHVDAWCREMEEMRLSVGTVARRLVAVRQWYAWLLDETDVIARNPAARAKTKRPAPPPRYVMFEPDEIRRMLARAAASSLPDELAFRLMAGNGLRVGEIEVMHGEDVHTAAGGVLIADVYGKGNKRRLAVLTGRTAEIVQLRQVGLRQDEWARRRLCPTVRTLQRRVRQWAGAEGIDKPVTPHALRHWACTMALHGGCKLEDVQAFLGHADPKTTMIYDRDIGAVERSPAHYLARLLDEPSTSPGEAGL